MGDSETSNDSLLCGEDDKFCLDDGHQFSACSDFESTDCEYIEMLIRKEADFNESRRQGGAGSVKRERIWMNRARLDEIKWILETRAFFGFRFRTAYLSLLYFDRFLSRKSIEDGKLWVVRLVSVACLSLAAKMEDVAAPALSRYPLKDCNFEVKLIRRMELFVLHTLEWRMSVATPFTYLNYFSTKFYDKHMHKDSITRVVEIIFAAIKDINAAEYSPSIVAAAAVLVDHDCRLTQSLVEVKINSIPSWKSSEKGSVVSKSKTLESIISQNPPSVVTTSSTDVLDKPRTSPKDGVDRRVNYIDSDQHCPVKRKFSPS